MVRYALELGLLCSFRLVRFRGRQDRRRDTGSLLETERAWTRLCRGGGEEGDVQVDVGLVRDFVVE